MSPKGVEHPCSGTTLGRGVAVIPSMSPKGVEHKEAAAAFANNRIVIPSMSPKGVEHVVQTGNVTCPEP